MDAWIALVGPELEENLSLRYLAGSLRRAGFGAEIFAFNQGSQLPELVKRLTTGTPPLLVGLSLSFQWRAHDVMALAMGLRAAGYRGHLTGGGHFGTFAALEILGDFPEFDSLCRQEAETTIVELAQHLERGTSWHGLAGLSLRGADGLARLNELRAAPELTTLPWPVRDGAPAEAFGHRIAPLVSSRGCYANCSFCCIAAWHEQALPGKRYRVRPLEDVADEMALLHHERQIEIFVFHDDDFFLPNGAKNLERLNGLADLLEARGVQRFATVVKARPTDVQPGVFEVLQRRLHCIRAYVGIESDSDQGLETLRRWAQSKHNHHALQQCDELGLYVSFNLLIFDPDTTLETLEHNLAFLEKWAQVPFNFGRVELYAGTPLLQRMLAEGRARGDWMQWDYSLHDPSIERAFKLAMGAFEARNFSADAVVTTAMGLRADVEVVRRFHPQDFQASWVQRSKAISRELGLGTVRGMREIVARVRSGTSARDDAAWSQALAQRLSREEHEVRRATYALVQELCGVAREGRPLTKVGDVMATALQPTHPEVRP